MFAPDYTSRQLGYERVYQPLCKVADTLFHIKGDEVCQWFRHIELERVEMIEPGRTYRDGGDDGLSPTFTFALPRSRVGALG